jgi:glycosyltransferase involved in cell wall biosynthesis
MGGIVELACFVNNTGFSHAAIDYAKSLRSVGVEIVIKCVHNSPLLSSFNDEDREWISESVSRKENNIDVQFRHLIPPRWKSIPSRKKNIALAVFESSKPPLEWINSYKNIEKVICPSNYCSDVFWSAGLSERPAVIPHAVDIDFWNNVEFFRQNDKFNILSIGTWRARKNWKNIIRGVELLSMSGIPIHLIIKTDKKEEPEAFLKSNFLNGCFSYEIIPEELNFSQMKSLFSRSDCLLSASIGEGFCISPIQAMSCGLPVVCSAVGGCLEYANDENCIRINARGYSKMSVMDNIPQFRDQEWAVILAEDVAESLNKLIKMDVASKKLMTERAKKFVRENFSYSVIGSKMVETIFGT